MKKKLRIRKKPVCTSKNHLKKPIFSSYLFKNKDFFKIFKTDDDLNYLAKFVEQLFSKPHFNASENAKNTFSYFSKSLSR
jgi:hypothetical protein